MQLLLLALLILLLLQARLLWRAIMTGHVTVAPGCVLELHVGVSVCDSACGGQRPRSVAAMCLYHTHVKQQTNGQE